MYYMYYRTHIRHIRHIIHMYYMLRTSLLIIIFGISVILNVM